jgi:hypothetical protein
MFGRLVWMMFPFVFVVVLRMTMTFSLCVNPNDDKCQSYHYQNRNYLFHTFQFSLGSQILTRQKAKRMPKQTPGNIDAK